MKRIFLATIFAGVALLLSTTAKAQVTQVFTNVAANADTTTLAYQPANWNAGTTSCGTRCDVHFWCASGTCTATVIAYCRISSSSSEPWYPCFSSATAAATFTTTGVYVSLANSRDYKFAIESWSSGSVNVKYFSSSQ